MRRTLIGASLLCSVALYAADSPAPLAKLTYSGEQTALEAIDREIVAAGTDASKLSAIEGQLLGILRRTDPAFAARQAAAQRLGRVLAQGQPKTSADAFKPLGTMLVDERDSDLARMALEPVPGDVVDGILVNALGKTKGRMRLGILDSIARRRAAAAVPALTKLLRDADAPTAAGAAHALGEIADSAAVAALHAFAEPSLPHIATAKLAAATRLPPAAALGLLKELETKASDPVHRSAAFRQSLDVEVGTAVERIAGVLSGRDWMMKQVAVESIGRSPAPNLVSALAAKLSTWDGPTQYAVIAALGRRRDPAATTAIAQAVKHQDAEVRAAAIEALGLLPGTRENAVLLATTAAEADSTDGKPARQALARMDGPGVSAAILTGAESGDARTRAVYVEQLALRNMPEALPLLRKLRADPDTTIRTAAVAALGEIAPPSEEKALLDWTIAATDSAEQTRALRSVVNVALRNPDADARGRALFAAIDSASPEIAQRLLPALARLGGRASAETAARLALRDDASLSESATTALARWTDATALTSLVTVAEKATRPETRTAATEGILRHFERNRDRWTPESTNVVSRALASSQDAAVRKKLVKLLQRANDKGALTAVERLNSDPALAAEATTAAEIIRANLAGPAKLRASTSSGVSNIMDGKTSTRWTTPALGEEWIEVDFRRGRPVSRITLDQTGRAAEFPEKYEVFVTDDPKKPGSAIATGKGQRNKTVIDLPAGTRGRYLIVKNVAERDDTPWAICELYVD